MDTIRYPGLRNVVWREMERLVRAGLGRRGVVSEHRDEFVLDAHAAVSNRLVTKSAKNFVRADDKSLLLRNASHELRAAVPIELLGKAKPSPKGLWFSWGALEHQDEVRSLFDAILAVAGVHHEGGEPDVPPLVANEDTSMIDEYVDCQGNRRVFELSEVAGGLFLAARELTRDDRPGLRFTLEARSGEMPPWGAMRDRIRNRLAQRSVVNSGGHLTLLTSTVRGQLAEPDRERAGEEPIAVVVDDMVLSWSQLGELLQSHVGFGIRLELREAGEE